MVRLWRVLMGRAARGWKSEQLKATAALKRMRELEEGKSPTAALLALESAQVAVGEAVRLDRRKKPKRWGGGNDR